MFSKSLEKASTRRWLSVVCLVAGCLAGFQPNSSSADDSFHFEKSNSQRQVVTYVHRVENNASRLMERISIAMAVPQSDRRQDIEKLTIEPQPDRITVDEWNQRVAHFTLDSLAPGETFRVRFVATVVLSDLEWLITGPDVGAADEMPERVRRRYLGNGDLYNIRSEELVRVARSLRTSRGGFLEQLRHIHDFVVDHIVYERDDRWDRADRVLERGTGSCSEYSLLMIALCRLNGIPARYAGGTCLPHAMESEIYDRSPTTTETFQPTERGTPNQDGDVDRVFHRWVEVYLPRLGWFPMDPTRNDLAEALGTHYRYFGRLPWFYLVMNQGDGHGLNEGLGYDYRSSTKWAGQETFPPGSVRVQRYATWKDAPSPDAEPTKQHKRQVVAGKPLPWSPFLVSGEASRK